jgi:hypothetical protein
MIEAGQGPNAMRKQKLIVYLTPYIAKPRTEPRRAAMIGASQGPSAMRKQKLIVYLTPNIQRRRTCGAMANGVCCASNRCPKN